MKKSVFRVTKMDCPSEEQMIRMKLADMPEIVNMQFDIPNRKLTIVHEGDSMMLTTKISELNLDSSLVETVVATYDETRKDDEDQSRLLWAVLLINFGCFILEVATGIIARSMGLIADSLDMLADALVYGLALYAVGGASMKKKKVAKASGILQLGLAVVGLAEVVRRFLDYNSVPDFGLMTIISLIALAGNVASIQLLQKAKSDEAHIRASMIFTSNDVIINIGVIAAAASVYLMNSNRPDLIVGIIVFAIVLRGAMRILKLSK